MTKPHPKNHPMRYIHRIDDRHHGWKVSINRANQYLHQYFTDSQYGGTAAALVAAMACRDALVAKTTGADYEIWKRERSRPNNTSGTTGLGRYLQREHARWQAFYKDLNGKRHVKSFSESVYGEEGAYALALQFRLQGLERVRREAQERLLKSGAAKDEAYARQLHAAGVDVIANRYGRLIHDEGLPNPVRQASAMRGGSLEAGETFKKHLK